MDSHSILQKAYLVDLIDRSKLIFEYIPTEISDSKSASYDDVAIVGRSEPFVGYSSSESRTITFDIEFIVSKFQNDATSSAETAYDQLMEKVRWCRSLAYPDYHTQSFVTPPHPCLLKVGKLLSVRVIVESVEVTYKGPWNEDLLPYSVSVSMPFRVVNTTPFGLGDVRAGRDTFTFTGGYSNVLGGKAVGGGH